MHFIRYAELNKTQNLSIIKDLLMSWNLIYVFIIQLPFTYWEHLGSLSSRKKVTAGKAWQKCTGPTLLPQTRGLKNDRVSPSSHILFITESQNG